MTTSRTSAVPSPATVPLAGRREWAALIVLVLAVTLLAVDGTVLFLAIPSLTADLAPTATQILWIGDIYSFVLAGLLVTMGNLADRIGRKRLLLIGAVGPLVGGVLLEMFWWGSVFLVNVPVIVAVVGLGAWLLPESRSPVAGRINLLSALLSVLAVVPVVFAIKQVLGGDAGAPALLAALVGAAAAANEQERELAHARLLELAEPC